MGVISTVPLDDELLLEEELENQFDQLERYHPQILHSVTASRNWTTDEFWALAKSCCAKHVNFFQEGLGQGGRFDEGHLPVGVGNRDDLVKFEIELAIKQGRITTTFDTAASKQLVGRIYHIEQQRRRQNGITLILPGEVQTFRKNVRQTIRDTQKQHMKKK